MVEVLRELQIEGVRILFSSTLVPADLVVKSEPKPGGWREIAEQILAPHGLTVAKGPGMTWLVVRATTIRPRPGTAPQDTRPPPTPEAPRAAAPDTLRIEEQVDVVDRAGDLAGVPSVYEVEVGKVFETAGAFENVFQVLSTYPGVAATDDEEGTFAVRGGGPEHNAIVFDGVQIHSSQRIGDFRTSFVNPSTTGSIALDASGLDARYGGRLSSVTVLETRDGDVSRRLGFSGSAGLTSADVLVEGRLPGTTSGSWWATARGTYYKYVAKRFGEQEMPGFADTQFKVAARPSHEYATLRPRPPRARDDAATVHRCCPISFVEGDIVAGTGRPQPSGGRQLLVDAEPATLHDHHVDRVLERVPVSGSRQAVARGHVRSTDSQR